MAVEAVDGRALGCAARLVVTDPRAVRLAEIAVAGVLREIDDACSRFRPDSELSRLNASPERDVALSPTLAAALGVALRAARLSELAEVPIEFRDRTLGHSKMSSRIVGEAFLLVTWWGVTGRVRARRKVRDAARRSVATPP